MGDDDTHELILEPTQGPGDMSRRGFVRGVAGVVVGGVAVSLGLATLLELPGDDATVLGRSTFEPHVGDRFAVGVASAPSLELVKVRALRFGQPAAPQPAGHDSFSLLFRGPADAALDQAVYELSHRRVGKFSALMSPMRPEPDARYYEVIFNRAKPR